VEPDGTFSFDKGAVDFSPEWSICRLALNCKNASVRLDVGT